MPIYEMMDGEYKSPGLPKEQLDSICGSIIDALGGIRFLQALGPLQVVYAEDCNQIPYLIIRILEEKCLNGINVVMISAIHDLVEYDDYNLVECYDMVFSDNPSISGNAPDKFEKVIALEEKVPQPELRETFCRMTGIKID